MVNTDIDEDQYSRQLFVLGHDAMRRLNSSDVLICGLGGLGVEIAKNIILGGVKSVTLHDLKSTTIQDLGTQFFLTEEDIGKNRASCSQGRLAELNSYVTVHSHTDQLELEFLKSFRVVVLTDSTNDEQQIKIGDYCHNAGIAFIAAETRGTFGKIFCDFGDSFTVVDTDGQNPKSALISYISNDSEGIVTTFDEHRHDFEDRMWIRFDQVEGMSEVNGVEFQIKVLSPYSFSIGDTSQFSRYIDHGIATEVKKEKTLNFKSMSSTISKPVYFDSELQQAGDDYPPKLQYNSIHLAFQALSEFKNLNDGEIPRAWNDQDAEQFVKLAVKINNESTRFNQLDDQLLATFAKVCSGALCPVQSVVGATASQEIMKACTGKFHPIFQYFYYSCAEILQDWRPSDAAPIGSRYDSQIMVLGKEFQQRLANLNCFLVGSGALGCEYLKNLAMMGACTGSGGKLTVTDMDTIEKSNLNRQFLFRSWDIQKPKAEVAVRAVRRMNPSFNPVANLSRVAEETEHIYTAEFFKSLDVVCNALDNVKTRLYVDSKCIEFQKPLIESGTLGTKGNVQVCIPFLTEAYSSMQDPPEKAIPLCTLKSYPNSIEHTIQWARDMFEGLFINSARLALTYLQTPDQFYQALKRLKPHHQRDELEQVERILINEYCSSFDSCVHWARLNWQDNFHNLISQLLFNIPADQKTSSGQAFWSGLKRRPHPLDFNPDSSLHFEYVFTAANLKASLHGIEQQRDRDSFKQKLLTLGAVPPFKPKQGVKIKLDDQDNDDDDYEEDESEVNRLMNLLESEHQRLKNLTLSPIEFEKDDDTNLHIDFITACSNLRAENYDITPSDRHNTKLIAGKIIPAIATTTSLIVGLDCIELYKLVQGRKDLALYRNSYVNLALPFFSSTEPMPVLKNKFNDTEWSLWDRIEIQGDITLQEFIDLFQTNYGLKITMLGEGLATLYSEFLSQDKKKDRMNKKITEIKEMIKKEKLPDHVKHLTLTVSCDDKNGDDVDIPLVRYLL